MQKTYETASVLITFYPIGKRPPFNSLLILETDKGIITGKLDKIDGNGHHFDFFSNNPSYWNSSIVKRWALVPKSIE